MLANVVPAKCIAEGTVTMRVVLTGSSDVLEGEPADIVRAMQSRAFGVDHLALGDYITRVVEQTKARMGVTLTVEGNTPSERAASLLDALLAHHLAERR
jgi:hypothetical protein